ncbi:GNAT family N-acetyltransferase [Cytobacillus sp. FJAT-54145]|uniref:GNAT family N-acetyltransferase n=1 Tax=Cytobacillus spartinae TaxID=3299023 RepID=A0ABW6K733_9BACI
MECGSLEALRVRLTTIHDCDQVIKMLKEIALWMKKNGINQWKFLLEGGDDEEIKEAISKQETFIVTKNNQLIATFTLLNTQSEWDQHIWGEDISNNVLYLHRLAIIPTYMKKRIGKELLDWIVTNVRDDKKYLRLDCVASNSKLNQFYQNYGFDLIGCKDDHNKYVKELKKD